MIKKEKDRKETNDAKCKHGRIVSRYFVENGGRNRGREHEQ